jgi:tetratricopeptide (TPR) repeat protein
VVREAFVSSPSRRGRRLPFPAAEERFGTRKSWLFAAVLYVGFFSLLEGALWLAGVPTLLEREDPFRGFSGLVSVFERKGDVYRTRPAGKKHTFNDQQFLAEKPENGLRIFTLGGSSAFGFPWGAEAAFTKLVGDTLAALHPERHVEAVNASGTSYAMHRLNFVADELVRYAPDIFLVYSGHNEFIEPAFFEALERRGRTRNRLEYVAAHTRVWSGLRTLIDGWRPDEPEARPRFGVDVLRDEARLYSPEEKATMVVAYRGRLRRLVRVAKAAGVRVVLSTVPANESAWRPEASWTDGSLVGDARKRWSDILLEGQRLLAAGRADAAAPRLAEAARLAPGHAETRFLEARAYEALGRFEEAALAYTAACDADASPIRRVSALNEAIRRVAAEEGTLLVDMDRIFRAESEHGLVGFQWIEDYVHPTLAGHERIAWEIVGALERSGWLGPPRAADRAAFDAAVARREIAPTQENATWLYNMAVVLTDQGRTDEAIEKYTEALAIRPDYEAALLNLGYLLTERGRDAEAVRILGHLLEVDPELTAVGAHVNLGNALQNLGRYEEAVAHYRVALGMEPDMALIHTNLGNALRSLGRLDEAIAAYEQANALWPEDPINQNAWGRALHRQGHLDDAIARFREAVRLKPDFAEAHRRWGAALAAQGRTAEATLRYREALRLAPDDDDARRLLAEVESDAS